MVDMSGAGPLSPVASVKLIGGALTAPAADTTTAAATSAAMTTSLRTGIFPQRR
jgi:hypothetical protein